MATPEAKATVEVRARASDWKARLFRNNSGVLMNEVGVPVHFGLGNEPKKTSTGKKFNKEFKSGDEVGWLPITITPEMVGKQIAVFTNIEVKALGFKIKSVYPISSREYAQNKFNNLVNHHGGVAGFASCWQDVDRIIQDFYKRVTSNGT